MFSKQPEIREITILGKNAEGTADQFSDIDIRIHSNSLLTTQQNYLRLIEKISPILETFLLASENDNFAQMIMLKDFSPYQKIDFGICSGESTFKPYVSKYLNQKAKRDNSQLNVTPINNTVSYNLTNYLFGVPRMTKCLFRKDFDMYRRWKGMSNSALILLYEKYFDFEKETQKRELDAQESKKLFTKLSQADRSKLDKLFPVNGNLSLIDSFMGSLEMYIDVSKDKAKYFNERINESFVDYIRAFAKEEAKKLKSLKL